MGQAATQMLPWATRKEMKGWWLSVASKDRYKDRELKKMTFADFFFDFLGYRERFHTMAQDPEKTRQDEELHKLFASSSAERNLAELLHLASMLYSHSSEGKAFISAVESFRDRCQDATGQLMKRTQMYEQLIENSEEVIKKHMEKIEEQKGVIQAYKELINENSEQTPQCQKLYHTINELLVKTR